MSDIDEGNPGNDRPIDVIAGEYVLGLLSPSERVAIEHDAARDETLAAAIASWQDRLTPLGTAIAPLEASPLLWERIDASVEQRTAAVAAASSAAMNSWMRLLRWQIRGIVAVAVAAVVAIVVVLPRQPAQRFVAVLQSEQKAPGWLVEADAKGRLKLEPLVATPLPDGRVLQFWTKGPDETAPTSLGIVPIDRNTDIKIAALSRVVAGQLFELTVEPPGGSTTGRPTGPILYVGRAVALK
jgi:anti-sigma-K factor RskA